MIIPYYRHPLGSMSIKTRTQTESSSQKYQRSVIYGVDHAPTPVLCFVFGVQQAILCIGGGLSVPFLLLPLLCAEDRIDVQAQLLSITLFMNGVATVLQTTFGIRLGVIQGGSHTFIPPIAALMALDRLKCPDADSILSYGNETLPEELADPWKSRMREIQGSLIIASLTQVVLGCTGLLGFILPLIGPLTIAPTISLIGLSLTGVIAEYCKHQWGIAFLCAALLVIFGIYLSNITVPCVGYSKQKKCHRINYPLFQLMPVLLGITITWLFCYVLTVTDVFPSNSTMIGYHARTDSKMDILDTAPWFYFPYPFQFGMPTASVAGFVGLFAATLSSIIESVGDYFAAARMSGVPTPPPHAVNRGIAMEGFASIISGMVGAGHATTTYSGNIGAIGITKVASRRVFQTAGIILIVCGIVGKIGAFLAVIPEPVIGGTMIIGLGLVASVGISCLQFADLSGIRNLTILGVSFVVGLMVPQWLAQPENAGAINTGNDELDGAIKVLLGTASFVGGIIGFIMDNTVPGTLSERGLLRWRGDLGAEGSDPSEKSGLHIYDFPYITKYLRKIKCCSYIPVCPTFESHMQCRCTKKNRDVEADVSHGHAYEQTVNIDNEICDVSAKYDVHSYNAYPGTHKGQFETKL